MSRAAVAAIWTERVRRMAWWTPKDRRQDPVDKGGRVTTPPGKVQKPKYADKKIVKRKDK
jgi:hypothetical protein